MEKRLKYKVVEKYGKNAHTIYGPRQVTYIYTVKKAAEYCKCSEDTIRRWNADGLLPALKECFDDTIPVLDAHAGKMYFLKDDLNDALRVIHAEVPISRLSV